MITEQLAGVRSASIGVWVGVGSRDETPTLHGCSHFLEHLLFKGTSERSALDISIALDAVGGEFNAFTAKEYTCFHARVLDEDLGLAVDVLGDMITSSLLTPGGRRGRARRDPRRDRDARRRPRRRRAQPVRRAGLRPEAPLGRPIAGTVGSIEALTRAQVARFYQRHYRPANMVVAAAGNLDHAEVVKMVRAAFGRRGWLSGDEPPVAPRKGAKRVRVHPGRGGGDPPVRAGQPRARHGGRAPQRRPPVRARRAQHRSRRRHVVPAVPGGARAPRPGLLGLLVLQPPCRLGPGRGLGRVPAQQARRGAGRGPHRALPGRRPRHLRRGAGPRQGPAARGTGARARGLRLPDVAASARPSSSTTSCSASTR